MNLRRFLRRAPAPLASVDAYALWAASYPPRAHNALMRLEEAAMLALMPDLAGRRVLDLGSGTGRYGQMARERGAQVVLALDTSAAMLAANALPARALASAGALPLPAGSVDAVLCGLALGHVQRLDAAMGEIGRVVCAGGWALVSDFHPLAFLSGARRTFETGGRTYAVEHYAHLYADYHDAARTAGLHIARVAEPRYEGRPVVIVYLLEKL